MIVKNITARGEQTINRDLLAARDGDTAHMPAFMLHLRHSRDVRRPVVVDLPHSFQLHARHTDPPLPT